MGVPLETRPRFAEGCALRVAALRCVQVLEIQGAAGGAPRMNGAMGPAGHEAGSALEGAADEENGGTSIATGAPNVVSIAHGSSDD